MSRLVMKFGGTSVSRRHRWDTIGRLAKQRADGDDAGASETRVLVVVSALSGVTNELTAIADGRDIDTRIDALVERHRAFCAELDLDADAVLGERLSLLRALGAGVTLVARGDRLLRGFDHEIGDALAASMRERGICSSAMRIGGSTRQASSSRPPSMPTSAAPGLSRKARPFTAPGSQRSSSGEPCWIPI